MATITFIYDPEDAHEPVIEVSLFDPNGGAVVATLISAFRQFLLAATYQPGSIDKYIDQDALDLARAESGA